MKIYKDTLAKLARKKKTNLSELSRTLGYNRNYLGVTFSKGHGYYNFPFAVAAGLMSLLDCTEDELKEEPKSKTVKIDDTPAQIIHGVDPELIREGFRMIHADLQELIRLWKPTTETIKIGGEHSK